MYAAQVSSENHLDLLAHPKLDFLKQHDRPSVYWQDKTDINSICSLTARQNELAQHKTVNKLYKEDRPSSNWTVKASALQVVPSPRIEKLAQAKSISPEWVEDKPIYTVVTEAAKRASASPRIVQLAISKNCAARSTLSTPKSHQEDSNGVINSETLVAPTARTEALAVPKMEHPQYHHDLEILRHVPAPALNAQASDRVCQLAKPKTRKSIFEGYDPYRISPAAKHAEASPRIIELSAPPARKQLYKKV
ncbi:testicular haploid expressed gene protein-like [Hyla sarda]|uniref:testicular haploid expressed gene protein-like n=1 Tax=Hyla sarda TaxID=327740 RepID=UPI0024C2FF64|nr:testicular haploid expressed gene protein-like [Hyla sarda]XP_056374014.1 testicular haploid expressed gene protein-like [Hyla sarda]XP_056374015.1 testicular haploid expressed gene protein-like [Hyla sarda]XP_056374016.1 testicular haploid expressed gene protein-like [Hyla sarda]XP_056374017.1 testicular haploid expressed gene protein-like [Hyla sarda]XP_056374018.1 testicular haploid expressed gene protein-like [Hyla sarda]XP_056374019.1 testicular haploid expressed gene protein-like [Hy